MSIRFGCKSPLCAWVLLMCISLPAHSALMIFEDRAAFEAAASGLTKIDFEGIVPSDAAYSYPNPAGLTVSGVKFLTTGTGPSGPGSVAVAGADLNMGSPALNTGTGAILMWEPPGQPGTAYLDVRLPPGITAFAADLWTEQPVMSSAKLIVNSGEATELFHIHTADRPTPSFFGVTSDSNVILLVRLSIPAEQFGVILDDVTIGRAGGGAPIPEPGTLALLGAGLTGIAVTRAVRRRS